MSQDLFFWEYRLFQAAPIALLNSVDGQNVTKHDHLEIFKFDRFPLKKSRKFRSG
jgi:hypothetical protein